MLWDPGIVLGVTTTRWKSSVQPRAAVRPPSLPQIFRGSKIEGFLSYRASTARIARATIASTSFFTSASAAAAFA